MGSENGRRWERADVNLVVVCRDRAQIVDDVVRKLGAGGMFIETEDRKPVGSRIEIEFELPGISAPLALAGRVAYVQDAAADQPQGLGIEFEALAPGLRSSLDRLVRSLNTPVSLR